MHVLADTPRYDVSLC